MNSFWHTLPKPIFVLAPMFGVTNVIFREMIAQTAAPDVYFTEFVSADAINSPGFDQIKSLLDFTPRQRPMVAQIWGKALHNMAPAARKLAAMGFDGIDINMGCPQHSVLKHGLCAGLINDPARAKAMIEATREGAGDLPVTVKTRIGVDHIQTEEWIGFLLEQNLPVITIHGRTVADMSQVPARWEEIGKAVQLRNQINPQTLIIGNGDVSDYLDGVARINAVGADGAMIGRGIFQDLYAFEKVTVAAEKTILSVPQKMVLLRQHLRSYIAYFDHPRKLQDFKRLFKMYVNQFPFASDLREQLMATETAAEIETIINAAILAHSVTE